ncbi:MAG: hypothetical protein RL150_229 [Candidatus Parcubacteria bacterium]|jgi:penicillin-binding protein 2
MVKQLRNRYRRNRYGNRHINPEDIFVDSQNLPSFDQNQFEGRIEHPISQKSVVGVAIVFLLVGLGYLAQVFSLQVVQGGSFRAASEENRLQHSVVFADRGVIYDRDGVPLAWNVPNAALDFSERRYIEEPGFGNLLGYVKYPKKDKAGFYYDESFQVFGGIEQFYNDRLAGTNGLKIVETNAVQDIVADNTISKPTTGADVTLTIDADLQRVLYTSIADVAGQVGFTGGAGIIMDVETGDVLAVTSYPEYDPNVLTKGEDQETITTWLNDEANRFLNRATKGLYTPGSIMKPYVALAGLQEGVVTPSTIIVSEGEMRVPNPYDPSNPTFFSDWKAHGPVNVTSALAYSSNIYFYQVGGGYTPTGQKGVGISKLEEYYALFGFGTPINDPFLGGPSGTIPNPTWKAERFDGEDWVLGDTYFTSIGQYGVQVTPMQVARGLAAIANGGKVLLPKIIADDATYVTKTVTTIEPEHFATVRGGMRAGVEYGTAKGLNIPEVSVAGKTGTAELGVSKARVNAWVTGFYPYESPRYAFVVVMEQGSRTNLVGGVAVMRRVLDWIRVYEPELLTE